MSVQFYLALMLCLGFILGVLSNLLVHNAAEYIDRKAARRRAMRRHPAGGVDNLHVGTFHVPRSRERSTDWLDRFMADAEADWAVQDQLLPVTIPQQRERDTRWLELPPDCGE